MAGEVAWAGHHHPCRHALPLFLIRDIRAIRGQIHPLGAAMSRRPARPLAPKTFWDETSQPPSTRSMTSGVETSRLHTSHAPTTPVISPALPLPLPQPVFKTLKGFQTVAGGKAVRPPPPVPRPQNSSPLRWRRGLGVVASQSLRQPSVPIHRDARRDHGDERKLIEGASLAANVLCARRGPAQFCVRLRGLRACASYREA